jgi:hypothetical protein
MRAVIFSFIPCKETSMVASTRIARFVSEELQLPLIWDERIADYTALDVLVLINGAFAFCKHLEKLVPAIMGARRIVWLQNDYTIVRPINDGDAQSPFRKAFVDRRKRGLPHLEFWSTCEKESKATNLSHYVNWNCLTYEPIDKVSTEDRVCYYGSFRQDRKKAFDKFFGDPHVSTVVSSPSEKFRQYEKIECVGKVDDLPEWLARRGLGLYLEDRKSHREFHSPPNRFYEMLSAGLPMVFEMEAGPTLRKAGYNPEPYAVTKAADLPRMLDRRNQIAREQREAWSKRANDERIELPKRVQAAWAKLTDVL